MKGKILTGLALILGACASDPIVVKEPPECANGNVKNELTLGNYRTCLDELADEKVVIYIGAAWCGSCKRFYPDYVKLADKYGCKAVFLTVDLAQDGKIDRPLSNYLEMESDYIPQMVFIDGSGYLRAVVSGDYDYDGAERLLKVFFDL